MNDAERQLLAIAAQQHQVFTRPQATVAGLSASAVSRRLATGMFVRVGRHTLSFAGVTLPWRGRLQAGILDLGPRAMRRRTTNGTVTSSAIIGPLDRCIVDGIPVASGTRTVVELIGRVGRRELGNAIDSAIRRRLTAPRVLQQCLADVGRAGRAGVAIFDELMESAGVESWLERRFLTLLHSAGLPRPAIQRTYHPAGVHVARVDFDFDPLKVVVGFGCTARPVAHSLRSGRR